MDRPGLPETEARVLLRLDCHEILDRAEAHESLLAGDLVQFLVFEETHVDGALLQILPADFVADSNVRIIGLSWSRIWTSCTTPVRLLSCRPSQPDVAARTAPRTANRLGGIGTRVSLMTLLWLIFRAGGILVLRRVPTHGLPRLLRSAGRRCPAPRRSRGSNWKSSARLEDLPAIGPSRA